MTRLPVRPPAPDTATFLAAPESAATTVTAFVLLLHPLWMVLLEAIFCILLLLAPRADREGAPTPPLKRAAGLPIAAQVADMSGVC